MERIEIKWEKVGRRRKNKSRKWKEEAPTAGLSLADKGRRHVGMLGAPLLHGAGGGEREEGGLKRERYKKRMDKRK